MPDEPGELSEAVARVEDAFGGHLGPLDYENGLDPDVNDVAVARGTADRRSDIDLWVLVKEDRMANQRTANTIRQDLEEKEFDTGRYAYEIDVEALPAVPNYTEDIQELLSGGIVVHDTAKFETVREMVFHGDLDE